MAIIVEDGTGLPNADSYISEADADAYFALLANSAWEDVENKEGLLIAATRYMLQYFGGRWRGYRRTTTQALDWPRTLVTMVDAPGLLYGGYTYLSESLVPPEVKWATAELALIASAGDLVPNLERPESSVRIGEISVTYDRNSPELPRYPKIEMMVSKYLAASGPMVALVRA